MEKSCETCIHNGNQSVNPSGCTGCGGVDGKIAESFLYLNYSLAIKDDSWKIGVEKQILNACIFLRENNPSIPSNILDFMEVATLQKLEAL